MPNYADLAFDHGPEAMLVLSERRILRASRRVEEMFGWSARELEGQSMRQLYPGQIDYEVIGAKAHQAMRQQAIYTDQRFMQRKNGQIIMVEARGRAMEAHDPWKLAIWTYREVKTTPPEQEYHLTQTEWRVAGYLANGFSSKEIAQSLGRSPRTVEVHRANMIRKLGVRNSSELIRKLLGQNHG